MPGNRSSSLHTLLVRGTSVFAAMVILGAITALQFTARLRADLERTTAAVFEEEQIADQIVAGVHGQVLAATNYLRRPEPGILERYRLNGDEVYDNLTLYLFRELSVAERMQVEAIKEEHQALEVAALSAFNLSKLGERAAAERRTHALFERATALVTQADRFVAMRVADRERMRARQTAMLRTTYIAFAVIATLLLAGLLIMLRTFQRRLLPRLDALAAASAAIAEGNYDARVPIAGDDELAAVGSSFNQMAAALRAARSELEDRHRELAETVERLRGTQRELVQNEKLSALGGMLAGLAHELNNPLASVLGNAELLSARLHELPGEETRQIAEELADPIAHEALRARELVRNLLQFSRQSEMMLRPVSVNAALDVSLALRSYAFDQAGLRLEREVEPDLWVVADEQRLQQAFLNVVNNAYDALVEGGGSALHVSAWRTEQDVEIVFRDDGPGLTEPERVFDPFYTTKAVGRGTGLGLAIVYRFVEDAGGTVEGGNSRTGGAWFRIRLRAAEPPCADEERPLGGASTGEDDAGIASPGPRRRVLVVEDEEPIRKLHRRILAKLPVDVFVAASGADARDLLLSREVDAVISDVKMPGEMNGIALFRWVCQERPQLAERFLFVTGDVHDPVLVEVARARPDRFITKPFQVREYLDRVGDVLRRCNDDGAQP